MRPWSKPTITDVACTASTVQIAGGTLCVERLHAQGLAAQGSLLSERSMTYHWARSCHVPGGVEYGWHQTHHDLMCDPRASATA
jgi:hypothetical protein